MADDLYIIVILRELLETMPVRLVDVDLPVGAEVESRTADKRHDQQ